MYSARPIASSASGNTSIEPPRSMAFFCVPSVSVFEIRVGSPRVSSGVASFEHATTAGAQGI